ncbi:MAG: AmmeMemoRadiSam system radical SAM enzyme [Candidatus Altiarchaeota archaeon]
MKPKKAEETGMTRREFIKKAAIGSAAVAVGAYGLKELLGAPRLPRASDQQAAPAQLGKFSREASHYISLGENVRCRLCPNNCSLQPDQTGLCRVRVNKGGRLYTLVFGNPASSPHIDPVEKKPLFHFLPGSAAYSLGTAGCNLRCLNCQNWQMSQSAPEDVQSVDMPPGTVVENSLRDGAESIAYTYNEPSIFYEYMLETAKAAKARGVRNIMVTNGYINREPMEELTPYLDAAHVDLKCFGDGTYMKLNAGTLRPVLDTISLLHEKGVWFEIVHLVVPTWTDDIGVFREMAGWLVKNIGPEHPFHISRFFPQYKLDKLPPTPTDYLIKARKAAMEEGLSYVYVGNAPELYLEDTSCPKCGKVVIARSGYTITNNHMQGGVCGFCGQSIAGVWG